MSTLFSEGQQEWKNAIIQTSDGKYVISEDVGKKRREPSVPMKKWQSFLMS